MTKVAPQLQTAATPAPDLPQERPQDRGVDHSGYPCFGERLPVSMPLVSTEVFLLRTPSRESLDALSGRGEFLYLKESYSANARWPCGLDQC
jgi:hypothetical protein